MSDASELERKGRRGKGRQHPTLPVRFVPKFWEDSDARLQIVKLIQRRVALLKDHCGGHESYQRDILCQRCGFLSVILETAEVNAASGQGLDLGSYIQAVNGLSGLLAKLGLEKRVKNVTDL